MVPFWNRIGTMATLSIKNVPADIVERLRKRAERNHRSMQGELMALICEAVDAVPAEDGQKRSHQSGSVSIEEIAAEHRARWPEPFERGPRAADLIRRDRDSR